MAISLNLGATFKFNLLPTEIQDMIWELIAQEPRVVSVHISRKRGPAKLRSLISTPPAVLHICSRSRAIALKYTTLSFASSHLVPYLGSPFNVDLVQPPKIYFNAEIDTLWFGAAWNQGVDGRWCCIDHLHELMEDVDLKQIRNIGFDLNSRICSTRRDPSSISSHRTFFYHCTALEKIYLGLSLVTENDGKYPTKIALRGIECGEEQADFMRLYDEKWRKCSFFQNEQAGTASNGEIGSWHKSPLNELGQLEQTFEKFEPVIVLASAPRHLT